MKTSMIAIVAMLSLGGAAAAQTATPEPTPVPEPNLDMTVPPGAAETPATGTDAPASGMGTATDMTGMEELDDSVMVADWNMSVDDIEDMDVYNAEGTKIGEVENVLGRNETAEALVVDFDDDAGYAGEDRIVPLSMLTLSDDRLELSADADVASFEEYDD